MAIENFNEIVDYLNDSNNLNDEVREFIKSYSRNYFEKDEDGQKFFTELSNPRIDNALKTFKEQDMPKFVDEEIKKRFPEVTPEQRQIKELQLQLENMQKETQRKENKIKLNEILNKEGLDIDLVEFVEDIDLEVATKKVQKLKERIELEVKKETAKIFKQNGRDIKDIDNPNKTNITLEDVKNMSEKEIIANLDAIRELYKK